MGTRAMSGDEARALASELAALSLEDAAAPDGDAGLAATARAAGLELDVTGFAPAAADASLAIDRSVTPIDADTTLPGPDRAARVTREVLAPLRTLHAEAVALEPSSDAVAAAHAAWIESLEEAIAVFEGFAVAFATGDPAALADVQAARTREQGTRLQWLERVAALGGG
jgi:hypothetical protein